MLSLANDSGITSLGTSPYLGQIGHATESAAVADGIVKEELHALVVNGLVGTVDDPLQHEVGLLQLVPEEEVGLREAHGERVGATLEVASQHIHAAEHPATPRLLLIGDALLLGLNAEISVELTGIGVAPRQVVNSIAGHGVHQRLLGTFQLLLFLNVSKHLLRDAAALRLCRGCGSGQ